MYYSKNNSPSIPKNYAGNAFRVIDESDRTYSPKGYEPLETGTESDDKIQEQKPLPSEKKQGGELPLISSLFSGISVEDILLLGLIFAWVVAQLLVSIGGLFLHYDWTKTYLLSFFYRVTPLKWLLQIAIQSIATISAL